MRERKEDCSQTLLCNSVGESGKEMHRRKKKGEGGRGRGTSDGRVRELQAGTGLRECLLPLTPY